MQHINYRRLFNEPYRIYTIYGDFSITTFILFILIWLICGLLFKYVPFIYYPIKYLAEWLPGGYLYVYLGLPILLCLYILKINWEGKKVYMFLYDYIYWYVLIKITKSVYCHDTKVSYMCNNIVFR